MVSIKSGQPSNITSSKSRILCYSPFNLWALHGAWEMTILQALKQREAEVHYVMCDGLYSECDVFAEKLGRNELSCSLCQSQVAHLAHTMQMTYQWLGRYLRLEESKEARRWADHLDISEFESAKYQDWDIGEWVKPSVHIHLELGQLDLNVPRIQEVFREYLYSGLIACFGLNRLLDDYHPDVLFLFNGRRSSTRVAFELATRRGIRIVCHERGYLKESLVLFQNTHCLGVQPLKQLWHDWGDIPLRPEELETIHQYMLGRQSGKDISWVAFSPPPQEIEKLRHQLNLTPGRPLWALFTSSDYESSTDSERQGPFPSQIDWIQKTLDFVQKHPKLDLIVRMHPNTSEVLLEKFKLLLKNLPKNVRMVMPKDSVSSYSLMDMASVGLVYHSMVSLEMACKGKLIISAAHSYVSDLPFSKTVKELSSYNIMLDNVLEIPPMAISPEIQRMAYRYAYTLYYRWNVPFPPVEMVDTFTPKLRYKSLDDLATGKDPHLDRVCRIILEGEAVCLPPTEKERNRSEDEEIEWFEKKRSQESEVEEEGSGFRVQGSEVKTDKTSNIQQEQMSEVNRPPSSKTSLFVWNAPLLDPSGYADEARNFLMGLDRIGVAVKACELRWNDKTTDLFSEEAETLQRQMQVEAQPNAIQVQHIFPRFYEPKPEAISNIGRTMFETDRIPADWVPQCNAMDEIWVPSDFNIETFAWSGVSRQKLYKIPGSIEPDHYPRNLPPFELPAQRGFHFLSIFDWSIRKGWDVLLRAYIEGFNEKDDVCLFLKVYSSIGLTPDQILQKIQEFVSNDLGRNPEHIPDIALIHDNLNQAQMASLYRSVHAYVMPSRGEGWGRPYMEAMVSELPVIGTGWSGNTEFMNAKNSYLISHELTDVPSEAVAEAFHFEGHRWAEPSVEHCQALMREVFEDREGAQKKGQFAREYIADHFGREKVAQRIKERLELVAQMKG